MRICDLDGHVERRDGLVADDELRLERQGAGDADALALAAAELVGVAPRIVAPQADGLQVLADALVADLALAPAVLRVGLGDAAPRR